MKLFSYVVDHDNGFAPNPYYGVCTLAHCKFGRKGYKNAVELAKVGDWVVGTGGKGKKSAGHGKLIYAMRKDRGGKPLKVLSPKMQKIFGDFDGHISFQRSPTRWVKPKFIPGAADFVKSLE